MEKDAGVLSLDIIAGIDIGGTKCAVSFGAAMGEAGGAAYDSAGGDGAKPRILDRVEFATPHENPDAARDRFIRIIREKTEREGFRLLSVGISCGGPLDSRRGLILSPPNLPLWDEFDCVGAIREAFRVPAVIQNDADASALAEWKWGAGRGYANIIFLTCGTGMGAGLILNGRLYTGACNMAGEAGHIRLTGEGPDGYGKRGSFEGFCSGGGIARLGRTEAEKALSQGRPPRFCPGPEYLSSINAQNIALAAEQGDSVAAFIYQTAGRRLGQGIAVLIDLLNPDIIILGSIYVRQQAVLEGPMREEIAREALSASAAVCRIVPAELGEQVGDYAALSVAAAALEA
jgi:glucokinase